jgi:anti-sigma factor (TIGR02949 family)
MRLFTTGASTMECRKVQEYFSAYLDGELPEAQARLVARHLEVCSHCQQEFQACQRLWDFLATEPAPVPDDLTARVLARLPVNRPQPWWRHLALAASLLLGVFLGGRLGLDLHQNILPPQTETMQLAWEGFEAAPGNSLDAMLASHELDNGSGS